MYLCQQRSYQVLRIHQRHFTLRRFTPRFSTTKKCIFYISNDTSAYKQLCQPRPFTSKPYAYTTTAHSNITTTPSFTLEQYLYVHQDRTQQDSASERKGQKSNKTSTNSHTRDSAAAISAAAARLFGEDGAGVRPPPLPLTGRFRPGTNGRSAASVHSDISLFGLSSSFFDFST